MALKFCQIFEFEHLIIITAYLVGCSKDGLVHVSKQRAIWRRENSAPVSRSRRVFSLLYHQLRPAS